MKYTDYVIITISSLKSLWALIFTCFAVSSGWNNTRKTVNLFSYYQKQILRWKSTHRNFNGSKFQNNTCGGWRKQDCQQEKMESFHESKWYSLFLSVSCICFSLFIFFILLYQDLVYLLFYAQEKEEGEEEDWLIGSLLLSLYPFCINFQGRQNLIGPVCIRCLFWANHLWPEWQSHCALNMATEILPWWVELVLRRRDLHRLRRPHKNTYCTCFILPRSPLHLCKLQDILDGKFP